MSVTEIKQAIGSWTLQLKPSTPRQVLNALTFFGHIAILPGQVDPAQYGDNLLTAARYVGVYRNRDASDKYRLKGSGMAFWLGDADDKGDVFETAVVLTGQSFANSIRALLPPGGAITEGNLYSVAGTYTGKHQWTTPREAITYVTDLFGAEWRVNNNGTLDAGPLSSLYVTTPKTLILRKGFGADLQRKVIPGDMSMESDIEDLTTRVVLLAEGEGSSIATGAANAAAPLYKDIHGNPIKMTRLISESSTEAGNAAARAQVQLAKFVGTRRAVDLSTSAYDVKGDFVVGDYLDVYDPESGFVDTTREIYWEGQPINPMALRCVEMSWPIPGGWTVAFRDINGNWLDLSQYYEPEDGDTTIVVGELPRGLTATKSETIGVRPNLPDSPDAADTTIPAAPTFGQFSAGAYQPADGEWTKSAIFVTWTQPLNTDGSVITDGDHYEIRYRVNTYIGYKVKWGQLAPYRWGELSGNRWGAPITDPVQATHEWNTVFVGWGQTQTLIQELTPGVEYEFQIRAVDAARPPHQGPWSPSTFVIATGDIFAPDVPAAPVVASSRISIQVIHMLGKASGGTFNLQPDLTHLNVHVGGSASFFPDDSNVVGKLIANSGMIQAQIPAVGTFQIEQTEAIWVKVVAVDRAGNKSGPSDGVQATVELIDDAHISDLTVSKITAGTIMAEWIMAGSIKTAQSGARVEIDAAGVRAYNSAGSNTVDIKSSNGSGKLTGTFQTKTDGSGLTITPSTQVRADWSINDSAGTPLENHYTQLAFDAGDLFGMSFWQQVEDNITRDADGGKLFLTEFATILSHDPVAKGHGLESYIGLGGFPGNSKGLGRIYIQGKWEKSYLANNQGAVWANRDSVGAGFSGAIYVYGPTMTDYMCPIATIHGAIGDSHVLTQETNTGFTLSWNGTAAHTAYVWCPRVESSG